MDEDLIIELWDIFKEYVSDKNKEMVATHYVDFLLGKDVDISVLEGLMGYDSYLDTAIEEVIDQESAEDEDEDEEDNWDFDEDED
jgi:hypothetical protein